jgi:hypothetical protein
MIERTTAIGFILLLLVVLAAITPAQAAPALQATDTPVIGITAEATAVGPATATAPGSVPVTGGGDPSMTQMIIIGLLVILGIAVVVGGLALMRRSA